MSLEVVHLNREHHRRYALPTLAGNSHRSWRDLVGEDWLLWHDDDATWAAMSRPAGALLLAKVPSCPPGAQLLDVLRTDLVSAGLEAGRYVRSHGPTRHRYSTGWTGRLLLHV